MNSREYYFFISNENQPTIVHNCRRYSAEEKCFRVDFLHKLNNKILSSLRTNVDLSNTHLKLINNATEEEKIQMISYYFSADGFSE